ncbi:hypothetical protein HY024_03950 [Candidatus Curtissbacteria bacterium]|nr:hypothetical protein [Candidatus Curtissbacteria bacterium]
MKSANEYMNIPNRKILTAQEHAFIGSGLEQHDPELLTNSFFMPGALFHGVSRDEVIALRKQQEAIASPSAMLLYDGVPEDAFWTMVMKLSDLDSEGNTVNREPEIIGIDKGDGVMVTASEELSKYTLSESGRRQMFLPEGLRADLEGRK